MFGSEARGGLTTSTLPVGMIARKGTAATPTTSDYDNVNSPPKTDGVAKRVQATSDETPAHNVQPMTAEILDIPPTGPSSPTATLST
ncbi:hypothetical protein PoB_001031500 [Plakobranchus ocellatus]|uniref:Uncharacterized protein n=1 Tax=Plakobranchus ocellatus TaxID=259542 RepID=A0AAV3YL00_9GAST|nr:hypothetical protein PoB_001031500 [Plakobranchus ocellatus]